MPPLQSWETFYVIVGSSAAALTGLQFVVMALIADARNMSDDHEAVHAFSTPTVVHFSAVLLICSVCSIPGHTSTSLAISLLTGGIAAVVYQIDVIRRSRRQSAYTPVFEDWLFHAVLPMAAYLLLLFAGIFEFRHPGGALFIVAVIALILLFTGIHNAWDTAVYITSARRRENREDR
jgi:hypothetical protein